MMPVMDDIKLSFGITMRMCIDVRGLSVSRPRGVRNAVSCRVEELRNGIADGILQRFHLADAFHALHITAGAYGNAGRNRIPCIQVVSSRRSGLLRRGAYRYKQRFHTYGSTSVLLLQNMIPVSESGSEAVIYLVFHENESGLFSVTCLVKVFSRKNAKV